MSWVESDNYYLSFSSLKLWETDPVAWAVRYLGGIKTVQNAPMAVGTVFDAIVKTGLDHAVNGEPLDVDKYLAGSLQVTGVEKDAAIAGGQNTYNEYIKQGRFDALLRRIREGNYVLDLIGNRTDVIQCTDIETREIIDVRVNCRPDLVLIAIDNVVVGDWKVNGYYSKNGASVGTGWVEKTNARDRRGRAECTIGYHGWEINAGQMSKLQDEWATQLSIGAMVWGVVDVDCVLVIEQAAWSNGVCRFGSHRYALEKPTWLETIKSRLLRMWKAVKLEGRPLKYCGFSEVEESGQLEMILQGSSEALDSGPDAIDWIPTTLSH